MYPCIVGDIAAFFLTQRKCITHDMIMTAQKQVLYYNFYWFFSISLFVWNINNAHGIIYWMQKFYYKFMAIKAINIEFSLTKYLYYKEILLN